MVHWTARCQCQVARHQDVEQALAAHGQAPQLPICPARSP